MKICRWQTYCKALSFSSGSWHIYLFLRSWKLKPSSPVWSDDWHCIGTAPPQSTDGILANEIGIHLLSFTLKCVLEDESLFLLSECRKGDFPISEGEFECCSIAMARDRIWQRGRELETWTREQMQWPGYLVKECAGQSQPYPWENSNDTRKCARHKREPGDLHKEIRSLHPAMLHFSLRAGEPETTPHLFWPSPQPQHTDTIYTHKFTLRPFKPLDKESLTHTHSLRILTQEI